MRVSHENEHVTHAVISNAQAINFSISDSAEFYHLLSSTLYSNQELAVVREVMCNAWDAHIEKNIKDIPIEITCNTNKLVIKDFGYGIAHEDMPEIYGTYGNSTKKNDGNQTGGFGLGCKAPFAYTDHFEVISEHNGIKTIYNLSKSNAQVMGKPAMIALASFPTTNTGLTVTISLKESRDYYKFNDFIKLIARNGDMHVKYNDNILDKLRFNTEISNYYITRENFGNSNKTTTIYVRYGNVIYPVIENETIQTYYREVNSFLEQLQKHNNLSICFQAPAHSISVTPSRESLSVTDHTNKTLNKLFSDFLIEKNKLFEKECANYATTTVNVAVHKKVYNRLLSREKALPTIDDESKRRSTEFAIASKPLRNMFQCAMFFMTFKYPRSSTFRKTDIKYRISSLVQKNLLDKGKASTYLKSLDKFPNAEYMPNKYDNTQWFHKRISGKLVTKLIEHNLNPKRLYVYDPQYPHQVETNSMYYTTRRTVMLAPVQNYAVPSIIECFPALKNRVILLYTKTTLKSRMYELNQSSSLVYFVYHVSTKKGEAEKVRQFFQQLDFEIFDYTAKVKTEISTLASDIIPVVQTKPKVKGLLPLTILADGKHISHARINNQKIIDSAERIIKPEFVFNIAGTNNSSISRLESFTHKDSLFIVNTWGHLGAIVTSKRQEQAYIKKGAKSLGDFVAEKTIAYISNNKRIIKDMAIDLHRVQRYISNLDNLNWNYRSFTQWCFNNKVISKQLKLEKCTITLDEYYISLYDTLKINSRYSCDFSAIDEYKQVPLSKSIKKLLKLYATNTNSYLNYIKFDELVAEVTNRDQDNTKAKQIYDFIISTLKHT